MMHRRACVPSEQLAEPERPHADLDPHELVPRLLSRDAVRAA